MKERNLIYGIGINDYENPIEEVVKLYNVWRGLILVARNENAEIENFKYFSKFLKWYREEMSKLSIETKEKYAIIINRSLLRKQGDPLNEKTVILIPRSFAAYLSPGGRLGKNGKGVTYSRKTGTYMVSLKDIMGEYAGKIPASNKIKEVVTLKYWKERCRITKNMKRYVKKHGISKRLIPVIDADIKYCEEMIEKYSFAEKLGEIRHQCGIAEKGINDTGLPAKCFGRGYEIWKSLIYTAKREDAEIGDWKFLSNFMKWYVPAKKKIKGSGRILLDKKSMRKYGEALNKNTVKLILK